ncbi:hypothetical protein H0H87_003748 [Tephrocybe sp. NHM501043]|nr:hypothetical protein H0H87_003748 [Tephrocybe sp. NHM501043]
MNARKKKDKTKSDPKNPSYVASVVATRIHNAFMLAAAWRLVSQTLAQLAVDGVTDASIKSQLQNNMGIRSRYLNLYDLVNQLAASDQLDHGDENTKKKSETEIEEPDMVFDWQELREAGVSFLDSIIIELCFPKAPYPKAVLYQVLRDAVEESPLEAKRFPQELWDAVGDLSISVELQQILEAPLAGPEGAEWKKESRQGSAEYEDWVDADIYSRKASTKFANYKDLISPLERTKSKVTLDNMWKYVNLNYKSVTGDDIDTLWGLAAELSPTPQWHSFYMPNMGDDSDEDDDHRRGPTGFQAGKKKPVKRLAITSGPANDSDDSMPELQSVSNSSDEVDSDTESDEESEEEDHDSDESGYDTEEEYKRGAMVREAMDIQVAYEADILSEVPVGEGMDPFANEDHKDNPFLKLLGSLRGRMFSSSPKLKTGIRTEPLSQKLGRSVTKTPARAPAGKAIPGEPKAQTAAVEDVGDEDEVVQEKKKKKKKKPKKKKAVTSGGVVEDGDGAPESPTSPPPPAAKVPAAAPRQFAPSMAKKTVPKVVIGVGKTSSLLGSTTSLPLPTETAQSARSYIQAENLDAQKSKVKSRPSHATVFGTPKKGLFSKFLNRVRGEPEEKPQKGAKHSWFSKLSKKSKILMHQLLNTTEGELKGIAPMKWDNFLRLMREMGFDYDPSTAGSSVRFDPPDKRDMPITFHKPHPDPTLQPIMLKEYAKRLKKRYGWNEEDFIRQTEA